MPYPKLLILDCKKRKCFRLKDDIVSIGRDSTNSIRLVDADVSRKHCEISRVENEYYLTDLSSRNGTLLNGSLLNTRKKLKDGDLIEVGSVKMIFKQRLSIAAVFLWWLRNSIVRRILLLALIASLAFGLWFFLKGVFKELSQLVDKQTHSARSTPGNVSQ